MIWTYHGSGEWTAKSEVQSALYKAFEVVLAASGDEFPLEWRIAVQQHGSFSVDESDAELLPYDSIGEPVNVPNLDTLADAKTWCESREVEMLGRRPVVEVSAEVDVITAQLCGMETP